MFLGFYASKCFAILSIHIHFQLFTIYNYRILFMRLLFVNTRIHIYKQQIYTHTLFVFLTYLHSTLD